MMDMKELYQQYQTLQGCVETWKKDVDAGKELIKDAKTRQGGLEENLKTAEKVYSERERALKQAISAHITEQRTAFTRAQRQLKKGKVGDAYLILTGQEPQVEVPEKEQPTPAPLVQAVEPEAVIRMATGMLYGVDRENDKTLWQYQANSCRPIFAQDEKRVFVADYKTLVALDQKTGEEISRKRLGDNHINALLQEEGILFVVSFDNLSAYDTKNLQKQWENVIPNNNFISELAKSGENLFAGGYYTDRLLTFDAKTGKVKWELKIAGEDGPAAHLASGIDGSVYLASCYCFKKIRKMNQKGQQVWETGFGEHVSPSVMKAHQDSLYVGSKRGYVNAFDAGTGKEKWESKIGGDFVFPWQIDVWQDKLEVVVTDPYYASECKVVNLNPQTGKLI